MRKYTKMIIVLAFLIPFVMAQAWTTSFQMEQAYNGGGFAPYVESAATNTTATGLSATHVTSGTPAAGIGTKFEFITETSAGNNEIGAVIEAVTTDASAGTEDFDLVFYTMAAGATAAERFRILSTGAFTLPGALTGTMANLTASSNQVVFDSDNGTSTGTLTWTPTTTNRTITLPDTSGTVMIAGGAYLALNAGGTNNSLTADNGAIVYSDASKLMLLAATATANQVMLSGSNVTPAWSTATYPATTGANEILFSSSANTIAGITAGASGVLVTSAGNVPSIATDIPTAVTIGGQYVYRAAGTDVPLADGGTNNSLTADNGAIPYSDASKIALLAATATAGQIMRSGSNVAPTWSTATYPATAAVNTIMYASGANVLGAIAAGASGVLVTSAGSVPSIATDIPTAVTIGGQYVYRAGGTDVPQADGGTGIDSSGATDGQLLIGETATNTFALATITGTADQVVVTNGANTITLSTPQDINTTSDVTFLRTNSTDFYWEDEFVVIDEPQWTTDVTTGAVAIQPTTNGTERLTTGGTTTNEESLDWNDILTFINTQRPVIEIRFKLEQITNIEAMLGFTESQAVGDDDYIQFIFDASVTNTWKLEASTGGAGTADVGAVADTSYHIFRLEWTSDTALEWFIDGASQGTVSANVPTVALQPCLKVLTEQDVAHYIEIDYVKIWQDRT